MTDREAFEQSCIENGDHPSDFQRWPEGRADAGGYKYPSIEHDWKVWQAALAYARQGTPSSRCAEAGEPDPHGDIYNCERAALTMGYLTDDELANAAFMNYDRWPRLEDIIAGKAHPPIAYMTAVKERIRWLSRKLNEQTSPPQGAIAKVNMPDPHNKDHRIIGWRIKDDGAPMVEQMDRLP